MSSQLKSLHWLLSIFFLVIFIEIDSVQSTQCFECESVICVKFCNGKYCAKTEFVKGGVSTVKKYCSEFALSTTCTDVVVAGYGTRQCFCDSFLCNGSQHITGSVYAALLLPMLVFLAGLVM